MLYNVFTAATTTRKQQIQPYFTSFYTCDRYGNFDEREHAWILIANASINNIQATQNQFKFDSLIAQISSVYYGDNAYYICPVQQPTEWKNETNEYRFYFNNTYAEDYIITPFTLSGTTKTFAEKGIIYNFSNGLGTFDLSNFSDVEYLDDPEEYYIDFETGNLISLYEGDYEDLQTNISLNAEINLTSTTATNNEVATGLIESLFAELKMATYTPTPPPEEKPEEEKNPDEIFEDRAKEYERNVRETTDKTFWLMPISVLLAGGLVGWAIYEGAVQIYSMSESKVVPALYQKIKYDKAKNDLNAIESVFNFIREFFGTLFSGIQTNIQELIKDFKNSPTAQKVLYIGMIALGIIGTGFLTGLFIKKKRED
jgi:hypothetical protein